MAAVITHREKWRDGFADRLADMMHDKGMTERMLRDATGIPYTSMRYYLIGQTEPTAYVLFKICDALGASADELLGLEGE